jgi:hypothetical protein
MGQQGLEFPVLIYESAFSPDVCIIWEVNEQVTRYESIQRAECHYALTLCRFRALIHLIPFIPSHLRVLTSQPTKQLRHNFRRGHR